MSMQLIGPVPENGVPPARPPTRPPTTPGITAMLACVLGTFTLFIDLASLLTGRHRKRRVSGDGQPRHGTRARLMITGSLAPRTDVIALTRRRKCGELDTADIADVGVQTAKAASLSVEGSSRAIQAN